MAALPDLDPRSNEQERPPAAEAVLLEGLAMAGLVAILRQLGDLAELAAEVSDGLQDQVMAVSARGRRLAMRAKHLHDAHLTPPSSVVVVHSKTNSHPRLDKVKESLMSQQRQDGVVVEAPPRSIAVVDHIKRCRGPPNLSALERFDAHGEGACLKRYTDPSFFRTAHSAKLHTHTDGCRSQTDASGKDKHQQSLGFLSMLRQLTHPPGSVSTPSILQITHHQSRIPCDESSPPEPHMEMDKANENHRGSSVGQSKDELERSSSLDAWLSPGAFEYETTDEESSQRAFSRLLVNHAATSNGPPTTDDTVHYAKQDSEAAETPCNKILIASSSGVNNNSCSQDTKVDTPPLVPIPPMKWLSVKVHTGPTIACRKSFGGKIVKATELSEPAVHSYEAWSEPEGTDQQSAAEARWQQVSEPVIHSYEAWSEPEGPDQQSGAEARWQSGAEISSCRGNAASDNSEANSDGNPSQASDVGVGGEDNLHHENAFFSAVEQLARMSSPPWEPRVASCDRITLRNGPSPIHRSRSILDSRNALLDQIEDKSSSLKPEISCEP